MKSVAAVVVTYNRKLLLLECLEALLGQSHALDRIILIDNASTDGTPELLAERGYLANARINYVRMAENTGGAGGFSHGVKCGLEAGYDWLWVMDDDAEPASDALQQLQPYLDREDISGLANLKVGIDGIPQYGHLGWFDHRFWSRGVVTCITPEQLGAEPQLVEHSAFVGLLVPRRVVQQVGLPRPDFFIHFDDCEYCFRLSRVAPILLVPASVIRHKDARQLPGDERRCLWFTRSRIPFARLWLSFYGDRNRIAVKRQLLGRVGFLLYFAWELVNTLRNCATIICFDDHKLRRLRFRLASTADAWKQVYDNGKARAILYDRQ